MDPQRFHRLAELFEAAWRTPRSERPQFLDAACAGDGELRSRVDSLLVHYETSSDPLRSNWLADVAADPRWQRESVALLAGAAPEANQPDRPFPNTIDRYELHELLGKGGFGEVYRARQSTPIVRDVALKLIKPGMDSRQVVARFEAERQALALMDHPAIARVFDAGTTPAGRPYFVMELVRGVPITDYATNRKLGIRERLELFAQVCHAVQHAHQKGVIHRDLKPGNILVVEEVPEGGQREAPTRPAPCALPKIIDFGIAKATQQPLTEHTLETLAGQFIGTPAYMSPEQADFRILDLDTRADIYALGALLYELLCGTPPFDPAALTRGGLAALLRTIREDDPPPPSARAAGLPRELDWIAMKCLQKDRAQRYPSAAALADDIDRFLRHEPVLAGPQNAFYLLRKLVRRNRGFFTAATAITALLIAAVVGTTYGLVQAQQQRDLADQRRGEAERDGRIATAVSSFLTRDLLSAGDIQRPLAERDERISDVLARAEQRIESGALADQPEIEAAVRHVIGGIANQLGDYASAERHARRALELLRVPPRRQPKAIIEVLASLGVVLKSQGRYSEAEALFREGQALAASEPDLEPKARATLCNNHAETLRVMGRLDEAEKLYRQALELFPGQTPQEAGWRAIVLTNLGELLRRKGDYDGAIATADEALATLREVYGPEHPVIATTLSNQSMAYRSRGDRATAEPLARQALEMQRKLLPPTHRDLAQSLTNLASLLRSRREFGEAEQMFREAVEIMEQSAPGHFQTALVRRQLGLCLVGMQRFVEAEAEIQHSHDALAAANDVPPEQLGDSVRAFVLLYDAWAKAEPESDAAAKAAEWRAKLDPTPGASTGP